MKQTGLLAPTTLFALLIFSSPHALISGDHKANGKHSGAPMMGYKEVLYAITAKDVYPSVTTESGDADQKELYSLKRIDEGEIGKAKNIQNLVRQADQNKHQDAEYWKFMLADSFNLSDALKKESTCRFWEVYNYNKKVAGYICAFRDDKEKSGFNISVITQTPSKPFSYEGSLRLLSAINLAMAKEPFPKK